MEGLIKRNIDIFQAENLKNNELKTTARLLQKKIVDCMELNALEDDITMRKTELITEINVLFSQLNGNIYNLEELNKQLDTATNYAKDLLGIEVIENG